MLAEPSVFYSKVSERKPNRYINNYIMINLSLKMTHMALVVLSVSSTNLLTRMRRLRTIGFL